MLYNVSLEQNSTTAQNSYTVVSSVHVQDRAGIHRNRDCENSVASFYDSKHRSPILHEGKELNQPDI